MYRTRSVATCCLQRCALEYELGVYTGFSIFAVCSGTVFGQRDRDIVTCAHLALFNQVAFSLGIHDAVFLNGVLSRV